MRRRFRLLAVMALAGLGVWWWWRRRHDGTPAAPTPAAVTTPAPTIGPDPTSFVAVEPPGVRWVVPVDGDCPPGFPVKANANSGIFHVPAGRFYARTVPERCYATAEDAEADGYRRAKA